MKAKEILYQAYNLLSLFSGFVRRDRDEARRKPSRFAIVLIFITAVVSITLCSKSSPIYPLNDWVDANCFFTVGKSLTDGKVLYRDIYEQKGPYLYFLHTIYYLISPDTFLGGYIFEIIACFSFLLVSYKTILLFASEKSIWAIPILSAFIYSSPYFAHGGSAEEYCLPLLSLSLYFGLKYVTQREAISYFRWFIIGLTASVVFWIKYTMAGIYIGIWLYLLFVSIMRKDIKRFLISILPLLAGLLLGSVPVFVYFIMNDATGDLFNVYFYNNIFSYSVKTPDAHEVQQNAVTSVGRRTDVLAYSKMIEVLIVLGFIYLFFKSRSGFLYYALSLSCLLFFVFIGERSYIYYSLPISIFAPLGAIIPFKIISFLMDKLRLFKRQGSRRLISVFYVFFCVVFILLSSSNVYLVKHKKEEMPQYIFKEIMSQSENPTLLNYGFLDGGFYTTTKIMPNCKYFCTLNIPVEEMEQIHREYIENGVTEYVITRDKLLEEYMPHQYQKVAESSFYFEKKIRTYYLYQRK